MACAWCRWQGRARAWGAFALVLPLTGCAIRGPLLEPAPPPPNVRLGETLELLTAQNKDMQIHVLMDGEGLAHVFIGVPGQARAWHVEAGPDRVRRTEIIAEGDTVVPISAAMGPGGVIHALVGDRHVVRAGQGWLGAEAPPWVQAGIPVKAQRLVSASPHLAWAFVAKGTAVGAPGRWNLAIVGGGPAAVPVPWYSGAAKLVLATQGSWYVLDPAGVEDAESGMVAARADGSFLAAYDATVTFIVSASAPRFAEIHPQTDALPGDEAGRPLLHPVAARPIPPRGKLGGADYLLWSNMASDPVSGAVLLVRPHHTARMFADGRWGEELPMPLATFWDPRIAPIGKGRFHALVVAEPIASCEHPVLDVMVDATGTSAPFFVGCFEEGTPWALSLPWGAYGIGADGSGNAFAVWPTKNGIAGRWLFGPP